MNIVHRYRRGDFDVDLKSLSWMFLGRVLSEGHYSALRMWRLNRETRRVEKLIRSTTFFVSADRGDTLCH